MNIENEIATPSPQPEARGRAYEAPRLKSIGTLADLTRGGDVSDDDDGFGSAGGSGVI